MKKLEQIESDTINARHSTEHKHTAVRDACVHLVLILEKLSVIIGIIIKVDDYDCHGLSKSYWK